MKLIYKIGLFINGIMLIFTLLIGISYMKYLGTDKPDNAIVMVEDGLSVNFLNGNQISNNSDKYVISITNNSLETLYYYIAATDISGGKEEINYSLIEKNNNQNPLNGVFPNHDDYLASSLEIKPNTTHTYELNIVNNSHESLEAKLKIGLEEAQEENFKSTLLKDNEIKKNPLTKIGEEISITDEGLIEDSKDNNIYYFRGNVVNNYVSFANNLWRIVKINEDGTIKLILNDYLGEKSNYYNSDDGKSIEERLDFSKSNVEHVLNSWYQNNLNSYEKYLATIKYCVDSSVGLVEGVNTYYLGYSRLLMDYNQENNCLGKEYNSRIGLLTADEAVFAGASKNAGNTSFYLYNAGKDSSWWTLTPANSNEENINYFEIDINGTLKQESTGNFYRGLKPVINLIEKTYVSGVGSITDPYVIKE